MRAQASVIGIVLLIGITMVGVTAILAFGTSALESARTGSQTTNVEHAMTQLDSRAAMVALGETKVQSVDFPDTDGRFDVRPNQGWVNISHWNYTDDSTVRVQTIANVTLGTVAYDDGDTLIGYQAGGVWKHADSGSVMISPPELHYQSSTLTFPVIDVTGAGSVSGQTTANVRSVQQSVQRYPNESSSYDTGSKRLLNPVEQGNVTITIHSEFYDAWATYFRTRTTGEVQQFEENETVQVTLVASRVLGDFSMPSEGNPIELRGMEDGHSLNQFTIELEVDKFKNVHWSLHESKGNRKFEYHVHSPGGTSCSGDTLSNPLDVSVYYYNGTGGSHEWQNQSVDTGPGQDFQVDCDENTLTMDLLGSTNLTTDDIDLSGSDNKWYYGSDIDNEDASSPLTFDQHTVDDDGDRDGTYTTGDSEELGFLIQHYLSLMGPNVDLSVSEGPGGSSDVNEDESSGTIDYGTGSGSGFLTFLHVSENRIEVTLD